MGDRASVERLEYTVEMMLRENAEPILVVISSGRAHREERCRDAGERSDVAGRKKIQDGVTSKTRPSTWR